MEKTELHIKLYGKNIRRFSISPSLSFSNFKKIISDQNGGLEAKKILYQDDENDWVTISSELEWKTAILFYLQLTKQKPGTIVKIRASFLDSFKEEEQKEQETNQKELPKDEEDQKKKEEFKMPDLSQFLKNMQNNQNPNNSCGAQQFPNPFGEMPTGFDDPDIPKDMKGWMELLNNPEKLKTIYEKHSDKMPWIKHFVDQFGGIEKVGNMVNGFMQNSCQGQQQQQNQTPGGFFSNLFGGQSQNQGNFFQQMMGQMMGGQGQNQNQGGNFFQQMMGQMMGGQQKKEEKKKESDDEIKKNFEEELKRLQEMGFHDTEKCLKVLKKYSGDITLSVKELIGN